MKKNVILIAVLIVIVVIIATLSFNIQSIPIKYLAQLSKCSVSPIIILKTIFS